MEMEVYLKLKKLLFIIFLIVSSVSLTSIGSKDVVFKRNQQVASKVSERKDSSTITFDKSWGTN